HAQDRRRRGGGPAAARRRRTVAGPQPSPPGRAPRPGHGPRRGGLPRWHGLRLRRENGPSPPPERLRPGRYLHARSGGGALRHPFPRRLPRSRRPACHLEGGELSAPGVFLAKAGRVLRRKAESLVGRLHPLDDTLEAMALRPYELHLELTNLCNANCLFCPYQFQEREVQFMPEAVFRNAVDDFAASGGGSVGLTPIVGDALIHPDFVARVRYLRSLPSVDRIWVTTNAILLDKHGIEAVLTSGLTSITISTSGFDEESYRRVYRSSAYERFRRNVLALVEANRALAEPLTITIGLRTDRPLDVVMKDPDFQPILACKPDIDFTWSFTSAGGRVTREILPASMRLRVVT